MRNITTEITINASPIKVWNALMDFESYPEWNPFIRITGKAEVGEKLVNTIYMDGRKPQVFKPIIQEVRENEKFRWIGHLFVKGIFDGEHYFELHATESGHVRFVHGENFRGILNGLLMRMIGEQTEKGFRAMNSALKSLVELQNSSA